MTIDRENGGGYFVVGCNTFAHEPDVRQHLRRLRIGVAAWWVFLLIMSAELFLAKF